MQTRLGSLLPFILTFAGLAFAIGGCESNTPAPKVHDHGEHANHPAPSATPKTQPEPAGPRLETGSFLLEVTSPQPRYSVGKAGEVEIELEGRGPWHVNQDYPIRVDLKGDPGVGLQQKELLKDDAKEFSENKVRFVAALAPAKAGDHELTCDVFFAMCTDENCVLEERTIALRVKVE